MCNRGNQCCPSTTESHMPQNRAIASPGAGWARLHELRALDAIPEADDKQHDEQRGADEARRRPLHELSFLDCCTLGLLISIPWLGLLTIIPFFETKLGLRVMKVNRKSGELVIMTF